MSRRFVSSLTRRAALAAAASAGMSLAIVLPARAAEPIEVVPQLSQRVVKAGERSRVYLRIGIKSSCFG